MGNADDEARDAARERALDEYLAFSRLPTIPMAECLHGRTYRIRSRNLTVGVFNSGTNGFVGIREKFGSHFLFTEYHFETGAPFGTACPKQLVGECPVADLREFIRDQCAACGKDVEEVPGGWRHKDASECKERIIAAAVENEALFKYLAAIQGLDLGAPRRRS